MAIYIAVFIGGTAFAAALNLEIDTMILRSLQDKYDDLKTEYDNLKLEYEKQTDQKYWKEYIVHV